MKKKKLIIILAIVALLLVIAGAIPVIWYNTNISAASQDTEKRKVEIEIGSSNDTIASILENAGIIKSKLAFKIYSKLNKVDGLQAGVYYLSPSMELDEIIANLKSGIVFADTNFDVTFIEGTSMKKFAKHIAQVTNNTEQDVYDLLENEEYIDKVIDKYWFVTDEVKNENIYYPLEGYLFPDTYSFESRDVSVETIFEAMLNQMDKVLSKYKEDIEKSKYSVHGLLTMASVCEKEAIKAEDRAEVAGVFYNRLIAGDSLGSDVTTYYAIGIELGERDLYQSELDTYNAYNTRGPNMGGKLPVGPISNCSESSIKAAIYPADTDNYFFVADKYGKLYFTKTNAEHTQMTNKLIQEGLWIEF